MGEGAALPGVSEGLRALSGPRLPWLPLALDKSRSQKPVQALVPPPTVGVCGEPERGSEPSVRSLSVSGRFLGRADGGSTVPSVVPDGLSPAVLPGPLAVPASCPERREQRHPLRRRRKPLRPSAPPRLPAGSDRRTRGIWWQPLLPACRQWQKPAEHSVEGHRAEAGGGAEQRQSRGRKSCRERRGQRGRGALPLAASGPGSPQGGSGDAWPPSLLSTPHRQAGEECSASLRCGL